MSYMLYDCYDVLITCTYAFTLLFYIFNALFMYTNVSSVYDIQLNKSILNIWIFKTPQCTHNEVAWVVPGIAVGHVAGGELFEWRDAAGCP